MVTLGSIPALARLALFPEVALLAWELTSKPSVARFASVRAGLRITGFVSVSVFWKYRISSLNSVSLVN